MIKIRKNKNKGFTLIELLVVVIILIIIMAVVLTFAKPLKRRAQAQDAQRWAEVQSILTAANTFAADEGVPHCTNLGMDLEDDDNWRCLGPGIGDCEGGICGLDDDQVAVCKIMPPGTDQCGDKDSGFCGYYADPDTCCCTSLEDWANSSRARDLTLGGGEIEVAQIEGDWSGRQDLTSGSDNHVLIDNSVRGPTHYWVTDADHYIKIYTTPEARHDGKWNNQKYILNGKIVIREGNVRVDGLQITDGENDTKNLWVYDILSDKKADIRISNNIFNGDGEHENFVIGPDEPNGGTELKTIRIWNNIFFDAVSSRAILWTNPNMTFYFYNNTIKNCTNGIIRNDDYDQYIKNNLIEVITDAFGGTFIENDDHNDYNSISENKPTDNALGTHGTSSQAFTFSDGFHLASDDLGAKDHGVDLSDDPYLPFTDDIDGGIRGFFDEDWDIGADEYGTGACCDLEADLVGEGYLQRIPEDPTEGDLEGRGNSEYYIKRSLNGEIWVSAPHKSEYHDEDLDIMVVE